MSAAPKRTALYEEHRRLNACIIQFAGWEMPLVYTSISDEHLSVRQHAGVFDISHMGEIEVVGDGSRDFLQSVLTRDISKLCQGQSAYSLFCLPDGGIIDDLFVYCLGEELFFMIVNASRAKVDYEWLIKNNNGPARIIDRSSELSALAIQGPKAAEVAGKVFRNMELPSRHRIVRTEFAGVPVYLSRTGYTGEDGFEVCLPDDKIRQLWSTLISYGVKPAGLGARDSLRLEMGYMLYGQDIDETHNPVEAGLSWAVGWEKPDFIGRGSLLKAREQGPKQKLTGFMLDSPGVPHHGNKILGADDKEIGEITSGGLAPSLGECIALGYIETSKSQPGETVTIDIGRRRITAKTYKPPFKRQ